MKRISIEEAMAYMGEQENLAEEVKENVKHPNHYKNGKHDCIEEMVALFGVEVVKDFCKCNIYKYRYRASNKNGQEDLDKADFYMDILKMLEAGEYSSDRSI